MTKSILAPTDPTRRDAWLSHLQRFAYRALGKEPADTLLQNYPSAFADHYRNLIPPRYALQDLLHLEQILTIDKPQVSLVRTDQDSAPYRLHFYSQQDRYLDEYLPILENLGLRVIDQVQFRIPTAAGQSLYIKSFTIKAAKQQFARFERLRPTMLATISAVMSYRVESDALNKLTLLAGMSWPAIEVLRTYRNYYLQLDHHSSRASIHHALVNNPELALCLFNYFEARFRPDPQWEDSRQREEQALMPLRMQLLGFLADIADVNDDRILRTFFNLIDATLRSNFHLRLNRPDFFIAIKIDSQGIIDMPLPRPQYEIYVHASTMEGIHLRAGKVSRGGIRWSDRPDDFRTEILGLMQTQISKNALIVPTGAKGGFVVKKNGGKADLKTQGRLAYITLIQGLLDLTDNYQDDLILPVPQRVDYDDPDPYLVVAADKGTAQFSDIANGVAGDYRFWLHDAFASGGSLGYDHKALGITARGAWECVKRHFRELGKDIQREAFTVVGIGSMDGDVFGNGMLLSPYIRLRAAFSGRHIFLDPHPADDATAFLERKRLFNLPGSSWDDYDRKLLSEGGGVYSRADNDIPISSPIRQWLGIRYRSLDGDTLIKYLLAAPIDLLWLGGIGTYVKASSEKQEDAGDRSNDNVRIDARDIKALVVGEGANLGFTQKARIEYALQGGRINTDAVDNSAGVDTSDHEVNLKILLMRLHKQRLIADYQPLFNAMTQEVCRLVLANNIAQSQCLSLEQRRCQEDSSLFMQLAERLSAAGFLDPEVESFPSSKELHARAQQALTRPELAVLMAAAKMYLTREIENQSALLHDDCCQGYLQSYFPEQLTLQFKNPVLKHPLAAPIKATVVSNKIINQAGCRFLAFLENDNSNPSALLDQVACYLAFDQITDADALRQEIVALDQKLDPEQQYQQLIRLENALLEMCRWTLAHKQALRPDHETVNRYRQDLQTYRRALFPVTPEQSEKISELGQNLQFVKQLDAFPLLVSLSAKTGQELSATLRLYQEVTAYLGLNTIYARLAAITSRDPWERTLLIDLPDSLKQLAGELVSTLFKAKAGNIAGCFETPPRSRKIARYQRIYQEVLNAPASHLLPYLVLTKEIAKLLETD